MAESGEVAIEQETASTIPALVTSSLLCIIKNLPAPAPSSSDQALDSQRVTSGKDSAKID